MVANVKNRGLLTIAAALVGWWRLAAVVAIVAGCSRQDPSDRVAAANNSNIRRAANLYQSYQSRNGWMGPKDEAEFQTYIKEFPAHRLEMMQVNPNDLDNLFKSERDGQPFRVRYGIKGGLGAVIAVVFEAEGENSKRQVAFTNGSVEEVDEARFNALLDDPGKSNTNATGPTAEASPAATDPGT